MDVPQALGPLIAALLLIDALRRVYAVGRTANDHFVAAVVTGCMGFYVLMWAASPRPLWPLWLWGMAGVWGLFFAIHRSAPPPTWVRWLLAYPSQPAYAFALWGGLVWLIRAPAALAAGGDVWWPGAWLTLPLVLTAAGTASCYLGGRITRHAVPGLPLKLVQLSDLHASALMHRPELDALVDAVNAEAPDLVLITGDLLMPFSEAEHGYLIEALARLEAPTFACPGNHDLPVLGRLRGGLEAVGIALLVDERAHVTAPGGEAVEVIGVGFHWRGARRAFEGAVASLGDRPTGAGPTPAFSILMAHDPRLGRWLPDRRFDLVLSGHTHGGQVAANMFGAAWSVLRPLGVRDQGWWTGAGARHYVHRGNWFTGLPPRMGVGGEIAVMEAQGAGGG